MLGLWVPNQNKNSILRRHPGRPKRLGGSHPGGVVATDRQKLHSPHWKPRIGYLDRLLQEIEYIGLRRILRPSGKVAREGGALEWP